MKTAICTISTSSHLFKVQALHDSVKSYTNTDFFCLVTDRHSNDTFPFQVNELSILQGELAEKIKKKYSGNQLRWACKSLYLHHLLNSGYEKVIYVDNDIFFYSSPEFLFEKLDSSSTLLTPHHYPSNPNKDQNWLEANYRVGLFNAGFIGVNAKAKPMLAWWAECCLYNIKKSYWRGLFDDQKYLDLVPVLFENVEILKHKGCNVAGWNILNCPRSLDNNNQVLIDGKWPIVFIHFNYYTIDCVLNQKDPLLLSYWNEYLNQLKILNQQYDINAEKPGFSHKISQYFQYIRYRINRTVE